MLTFGPKQGHHAGRKLFPAGPERDSTDRTTLDFATGLTPISTPRAPTNRTVDSKTSSSRSGSRSRRCGTDKWQTTMRGESMGEVLEEAMGIGKGDLEVRENIRESDSH